MNIPAENMTAIAVNELRWLIKAMKEGTVEIVNVKTTMREGHREALNFRFKPKGGK